MRNHKSHSWLVIAIAGVLAAAGCSSEEDKNPAPGSDAGADAAMGDAAMGTDASSTVSVSITAAAGGAVASTSGTANLQIPAGALAADTTITVAELPANDSVSPIYDFGPDGTTFLSPVTLAIDYSGTVPEGKKVVVAWANTGSDTWTPIDASTQGTTSVSAPVEHFTLFKLILVDGEAVLSGSCDTQDTFTACGGNLIGTWAFDSVCGDFAVGGNPFEDSECTDLSYEVDVQFTGTIVFDATTATLNYTNQTFTSDLTIAKSCIDPENSGLQCSAIFEGMPGASCTDTGDHCKCIITHSNDDIDEPEVSNYTAANGVINREGDSPVEYCITGNTMVIRAIDDDEEDGQSVIFFTLKKQP